MFKVLYQRLEDGKKYQSTFFSDLLRFKYNRHCNDILFFSNYSDLLILILSQNGLPLSSLASRLAITQVHLFLTQTQPPSTNINSSIIIVYGVGNGNCMGKMLISKFSLPFCSKNVLASKITQMHHLRTYFTFCIMSNLRKDLN